MNGRGVDEMNEPITRISLSLSIIFTSFLFEIRSTGKKGVATSVKKILFEGALE